MKYLPYILVILFCISCKDGHKKKLEVKDITFEKVVTDTGPLVPPPPPPKMPSFDITVSGLGLVKKSSTYKDLQNLFGEKNVTDTIGFGPEGMDTFQVTKIFSGAPDEVTIQWKENKFHKQISVAELYSENSPYHTGDGLKIGSTLEELLKANGKKINFYGTGWDYGGMITSYNKGKFDKSNIFFQLSDKEGMDEKLMGDQELNTDMPLVKKNLRNIIIGKISVSFER